MNKKIIISLSFLVIILFIITIISFTPIFRKNIVSRDNIYEKTSLNKSINKIYKATVLVESYRNNTLINNGTAFIYRKDDKYGYLLTNQHVVKDSNKVKLVLYDDREVDAKVLSMNEYLDLAVLRIDNKYVDLVATIGSSKKALLGDSVFAVGSPLGYDYRNTVTSGIISGKDRMVKVKDSDLVMRVMQVDVTINPGNSGGPLLNVNGEVIGICTLKFSEDGIEGMSFALPIEYAINHIDDLENNREIKYPTLGIKATDTNDTSSLFSNDIDINTEIDYGVVVLKLESNKSKLSGLKKGDIITKINGNRVKDLSYLEYELYQYKSNDTVTITYLRKGKEMNTKIVLD